MTQNQTNPETRLTQRQRNLLFAVIKEYCEFGASVGSKELKEKYGFNFSPATIRSETVKLRDLGYLYQPFTNSSSQPTEKAFKIFINQLILGLQVTSHQQQELKKQILELEEKQGNMHKEISRLLAVKTGGVGFSLDSNHENIAGISNLLSASSGEDSKVSDILNFLDNIDSYKGYLLTNQDRQEQSLLDSGVENKQQGLNQLTTVIGGENPVLPLGNGYAMVATEVFIDNQKTVVGLITPVHVLARKKNLELVQALGSVLGDGKENKSKKSKRV